MSGTSSPPLLPPNPVGASVAFEEGAVTSSTPSSTSEALTYLASPKTRGPFMRIDLTNPAEPMRPRHREFTLFTTRGPMFEPAYEGRRYLINTQTRDVFSRTGAKLVSFCRNEVHEMILTRLCSPFGSVQPTWLEVVYPCMKTSIGGELKPVSSYFMHAAIVLDVVQPNTPEVRRRAFLQERFDIIGIRQRPAPGSVHLVPQFPLHMSCSLAAAVALQNKEFHGRLFSGIISKAPMAYYPVQKVGPYQTGYAREFFPINNLDGYHES